MHQEGRLPFDADFPVGNIFVLHERYGAMVSDIEEFWRGEKPFKMLAMLFYFKVDMIHQAKE